MKLWPLLEDKRARDAGSALAEAIWTGEFHSREVIWDRGNEYTIQVRRYAAFLLREKRREIRLWPKDHHFALASRRDGCNQWIQLWIFDEKWQDSDAMAPVWEKYLTE